MNRRGVWVLATCAGLVALTTTWAGAGAQKNRQTAPKDVELVGRIVDLQSYMTGKAGSNDMVRWTQMAIRSGVPAGLETEDGLVIIGQGDKGPMRTILPLAYKTAELKGKYYEKDGICYIDITSATRVRDAEGDAVDEEAEAVGTDDPDAPPDE